MRGPRVSGDARGGRLSAQYAVIGSIPVGGGPISVAVRDGRTVGTRNILTDSKLWLAPPGGPTSSAKGFKATAAAPAAKDRILGALVVHYWTERTFGSEEIAALEFLAKQAAIAIRNASLYEAERAEAARIRRAGDRQPPHLERARAGRAAAHDLRVGGRAHRRAAGDLLAGRRAAPHAVVHERLRRPRWTDEFSPRVVTYEQGGVGWVARQREPWWWTTCSPTRAS